MHIDDDNIWTFVGIALVVVWAIGFFVWQDPIWPLTILFNLLGDLGLGHGTATGYPWENDSAGKFPHSRYQ